MAFFSDLWNGIKNVGAGLLQIVDVIAESLIDAVFWLIDRVFDAIEAVFDLVEWTFGKIGDWLSPKDKTGEINILPPTPEVVNIMKELEKGGKVTTGQVVSIKNRTAALQVLSSDGKVQKVLIAGSNKGFSSEIDNEIKQGKIYKIPVAE